MVLRSLARRLGFFQPTTDREPRRPRRRRPELEALEARIALNNRFVVPRELPADNVTTFHLLSTALLTPGLVSGNFVQIEPGAMPGSINNAHLPAISNLTLRGHPAFAARDLPAISTTSPLIIDAARGGLKLDNLNLNLSGGGLTLSANATLVSSYVVYSSSTGGDVITLSGTTAAVLRNNTIISETGSSTVIQVHTTAGSNNIIAGNTVSVRDDAVVLSYTGPATVGDRLENNSFFGIDGFALGRMVIIQGGVNGLVIQRNLFRDNDTLVAGLVVDTAQNISVLDNTFEFPAADADNVAIQVLTEEAGSTGVVIARNQFRGGTGISFRAPALGTLTARVEGNNFISNAIGVVVNSAGASVSGVDLGGGSQGSAGANNFRSFKSLASSTSGAIVVGAGSAAGSTVARNNLFGTSDPRTSIYDGVDNNALASVTTTGAVTGNAAFVQALYLKFLRRIGTIASPSDAGGWVNLLNAGLPSSVVAASIARSPEALGLIVDDLYRRVLGRDADAGGRAATVSALVAGVTLEQVQANFFASPEYRLRFAGDAAYITSLYQGLLGRTPLAAEINGWLLTLPAAGRAAVAAGFLASPEFRARFVTGLYVNLLKRPSPPVASEVNGHVSGGQDLLSLTVTFASTAEFQTVG